LDSTERRVQAEMEVGRETQMQRQDSQQSREDIAIELKRSTVQLKIVQVALLAK
jgi:hypothetical protein